EHTGNDENGFWTTVSPNGRIGYNFTGTYYWQFWNSDVHIGLGELVEVNGRVYVLSSGYYVPKEKLDSEILSNWEAWEDYGVRAAWLKANAINPLTDFTSTYASGMRQEVGTDPHGKLESVRRMGLAALKDTYVKGPLTTAGASIAFGAIRIGGILLPKASF